MPIAARHCRFGIQTVPYIRASKRGKGYCSARSRSQLGWTERVTRTQHEPGRAPNKSQARVITIHCRPGMSVGKCQPVIMDANTRRCGAVMFVDKDRAMPSPKISQAAHQPRRLRHGVHSQPCHLRETADHDHDRLRSPVQFEPRSRAAVVPASSRIGQRS